MAVLTKFIGGHKGGNSIDGLLFPLQWSVGQSAKRRKEGKVGRQR